MKRIQWTQETADGEVTARRGAAVAADPGSAATREAQAVHEGAYRAWERAARARRLAQGAGR